MTNLKTLKDIWNGEDSRVEAELKISIKQEGVKWVKNRGIKIDSDFCEFLNITEEDLR